MNFTFLIEDASGETLIHRIMEKYTAEYPTVEYTTKAFKGLGGLPKNIAVDRVKTGKLLNDLPQYLRGFDYSFRHIPGACLFIVLDNDARDTDSFYAELRRVAAETGIALDHVFCVAIEEMEAWLLGDRAAIEAAYPSKRAKINTVFTQYEQDSICGTWEKLAEALIDGGYRRYKRTKPSYIENGQHKNEWANRVGLHMDIRRNASPSFNRLIHEMDTRVQKG
jgi:hypothetical protein